MSAEPKLTPPRNGQHVSSAQHEGIFEIVFVNALMQTANIRPVNGVGPVVPNVPWAALRTLEKR